MPTKNKKSTKSRTSKSKANKKAKFPLLVVVLFILIITGIGVFVVYKSYATPLPPILTAATYTKTRVHCSQGACRADAFVRRNPDTGENVPSRPHTVFTQRVPESTCISRVKYREERFVNAPSDLPFGGTALGKFDEDNGGKRRSGVLRSDVCLEPPIGFVI